MGKRRKVAVVNEEKENEDDSSSVTASNSTLLHGPMYTIMSNVQLNETFHKRYVKEMQQLYAKMDHDAFIFTFIKMIKSAMEADEGNEYANTTLLFCAKFVSSFDSEETHVLLVDTCKWLMTTISNNPHIRFRLCQFVNMILNALGQEAALDDAICDRIMEYMLARLRDVSPSVRVQATLAMQRLQVPDNPADQVLRSYQFHLCSDPSPRVRQAVITCMGRNYHTIPFILDRLWDIDEKVRRHTYLHMSSYPVRSYKVSQRLMLLEQGLNDRSEAVRKVVTSIMLKQWIESYQKDLIALISALKLDSNETEINRFRKITKQALKAIFLLQSKEDLLQCLPFEEDDEFHHCVPLDKLTMEIAFYWQCLTEFLHFRQAEELDLVVPELSAFCAYVESFCQMRKTDMDKFEQMEFQYILLSLMHILYTFDLGDEIGRGNLQNLLAKLLKSFTLDEKVIEIAVRCAENLITDQNARLQFFADIIRDICDLHPKQNDVVHYCNQINELLANSSDSDLNLKLTTLKVKLMDLDEQEMDYLQRKDYVRAQEIAGEKSAAIEKHMHLLQKHATGSLQLSRTVKNEDILKSLQITFHMVVSPKVLSLNPSICKLYTDFICRHIASPQIAIRDWALKCGTAYSMLYETLAKDVFDELYSQFFKNHNIRIWETSITCIFELLDRYGVENFVVQEHQIKSKKSGRQLYNTLEFLDVEDETHMSIADQGVGVIYMMSHFLDTCDDVCILRAIIKGFCCLVLRGFIKNSDIIEKLLLRYFNPTTDAEINQMLGVFLENLIARKQHALLQPCLLPTISTVMSAPYDSPLHEIRPETITRFIIDATRQESCSGSGNVHNKLAHIFLQEMLGNVTNKELCKLMAKELLALELNVTRHAELKQEMREMSEKLIKSDFDSKTVKNIIDFKDMLDGVYNPPRKSANDNESEDESKSDDETATTTSVNERTAQAVAPRSTAESDALSIGTESESQLVLQSSETTVVNTPEKSQRLEAPAEHSTQTPLAPDKTISPSALTPTTYGPDNIVGHRFLRKSLNLTRSQSDTEIGDGPSRPNKIRIEARIDSDKKSAPATAEPKSRTASAAARRNLRYANKNAIETERSPRRKNAQASPQRNVVQNNNSTQAAVATEQVDATEPVVATEQVVATAQVNATPQAVATEQGDATEAAPPPVRKSPPKPKSPTSRVTRSKSREKEQLLIAKAPPPSSRMPVRINTRHAARKAALRSSPQATPSSPPPTATQSGTSEEWNDSDIIPPSPELETVPRLNVTRQLRAAVSNKAKANSPPLPTRTRSATGNGAARALRLAARTKVMADNRAARPGRASSGKTKAADTPLRNGRKRVLQTATPTYDANRISPLRKQQRTEPLRPPSKSPNESTTEANTQTVRENGSPSSSKENELRSGKARVSAQAQCQTNAVAARRNSSKSSNNARASAQSQTNTATARRSSSKSSNNAAASNRMTTTSTTTHVSASSVTTRHSARKELEANLIMTRKRRLSLDNSSDGSLRGRSTSAGLLQQRRATKKPSKIPVRSAASKTALGETGTTRGSENGSTSSSSSSSSEGGRSSKSKLPRRKSLTTKMTRINLTVSSTTPVPMQQARPIRACTPPTDTDTETGTTITAVAAAPITAAASTSTGRPTRRRNR